MKGYNEEAKESMQFVYKGNIEDEFDKMAETMGSLCCRNDDVAETDDDLSTTSVCSDQLEDPKAVHKMRASDAQPSLWDKRYRSVLMIGVGLLASQQFSGQPSVLAYSRVLFEAAGWTGHASVVTVTIMGITSAITVALVDKLGRKILLSAGCVFMATGLLSLAFGFWGWDESKNFELDELKKNLILGSMFVYIAGYQVGYGPITWTVLSEIYPSEIRGSAMAFSVEINFLSKFLCQLFFPIIQDFLGWGCTFVLFACVVLSSLIFINIMVPETKGLSLEEIQIKLNTKESDRRMKRAGSGSFDSSSKPLSKPLLMTSVTSSTEHMSCALTPIV
jgi:MFS family permease